MSFDSLRIIRGLYAEVLNDTDAEKDPEVAQQISGIISCLDGNNLQVLPRVVELLHNGEELPLNQKDPERQQHFRNAVAHLVMRYGAQS